MALAGSAMPRLYGRMPASSRCGGGTLNPKAPLGSAHAACLEATQLAFLLRPWGSSAPFFPRGEGAVVAGHAWRSAGGGECPRCLQEEGG